ncbi:hypothetical protein TanjilG_24422 [Lupinus angustifolius]|uniref:Uncharacterized protein n=1 Tax=Lupinus angustifolius TaxID=3871 RepID=A0A1J7FYW3_LUPAN|nr:PREDICTED: extensin-1-like [Lupinus angustifolius]OIV93207.1 hypothetical protein TanjilG_24422 [Lupinus angustifolius]
MALLLLFLLMTSFTVFAEEHYILPPTSPPPHISPSPLHPPTHSPPRISPSPLHPPTHSPLQPPHHHHHHHPSPTVAPVHSPAPSAKPPTHYNHPPTPPKHVKTPPPTHYNHPPTPPKHVKTPPPTHYNHPPTPPKHVKTPPPTHYNHPPTPPKHVKTPPPSPKVHDTIPRTFIAVQGVVYVMSCEYPGIDTLWKATPLLGAIVKLQCHNTIYTLVQTAKTDNNGYFLLEAPEIITNYGAHKCNVVLVSAPDGLEPSNINGGITGSPLRFQNTYESPKGPFTLYSVGPLAFKPKCPR